MADIILACMHMLIKHIANLPDEDALNAPIGARSGF
jgi:hypothetical protein